MGDLYKFFVSENPLEVGDKVRVLRRAYEGEKGWSAVWDDDMNYYVGKVSQVIEINCYGAVLQSLRRNAIMPFTFPHFVLEKVPPSAKLDIESDPYWEEGVGRILTKGEQVLITRAAKNYEKGWRNVWAKPFMDSLGVNTYEVVYDLGKQGVSISPGWKVPHYILELVNEK